MAATAIKVRVRDRGYNALMKRARALRGTVTVGIHAQEGDQPKLGIDGSPQTATLGEVALYHEFGTARLPERSYIRSTVDEHKGELTYKLTKTAERALKGEVSVYEGLTRFGLEFREMVLAKILSFITPSLTQTTVDLKKAAQLDAPEMPLVATRQLIDAISVKVRRVVEGR